MTYVPRLYTPRLCLRPFGVADAARVEELAGERRVAATTMLIPHPYPAGGAVPWIQGHGPGAAAGRTFVFAITLAGTRTPGREHDLEDTGYVIGAIELAVDDDPEQRRGCVGYWVGVPFWNKGFATEAVRAVLEFGFGRRHLHRIGAWHFGNNPASGRVMAKAGMTREGVIRGYFCKWGEWVDRVEYGILEEEWVRARKVRRAVGREMVIA